MLQALEYVVSNAIPKAQIPGYRVGGKSGTAKVAVAGGYGKDYMAWFAGFAPASNPRFVMVVVINEPKGDAYYGGAVATPPFAEAMGGCCSSSIFVLTRCRLRCLPNLPVRRLPMLSRALDQLMRPLALLPRRSRLPTSSWTVGGSGPVVSSWRFAGIRWMADGLSNRRWLRGDRRTV